jgi:hypothetical protein
MVRGEHGGVVLRLILWVVLLAIVASGVLFAYVRIQEPLAWGETNVRTTRTGDDPDAPRLRPGATIYAATLLRNEGRMPVTVQGLGANDEPGVLFVATALALGDGTTAGPGAGAAFSPITIDPGEGVGIVVTYEVNEALDCSSFTNQPGGAWPLRDVTLEASAYAMPFTQTVTASPPLAEVLEPTREQCRAAVEHAAA